MTARNSAGCSYAAGRRPSKLDYGSYVLTDEPVQVHCVPQHDNGILQALMQQGTHWVFEVVEDGCSQKTIEVCVYIQDAFGVYSMKLRGVKASGLCVSHHARCDGSAQFGAN